MAQSTPGAGSRTRRAARRASTHGRSVVAVLQGLVPVARRLVGAVRVLAIASAVSIAVIVVVFLAHGPPGVVDGLALLIIVAVLVPAPVLLWMFHGALREALELPAWLRDSPELAKGHASELADLVVEARTGSRRGAGHLLRDTGRAGKLLLETHDDLPGYGSLLRLVSPLFLIAVLLAVVAALFEIMLAGSVVTADLLVRLLS